MSELIPVTDELLERARNDQGFRHQLVAEHLNGLVAAMRKVQDRAKIKPDPAAVRHLQEGARLAVKLTEILHKLNERSRSSSGGLSAV